MISPNVIQQIEELLEEGKLSRRQIAEIAGVARSTITAVARGERCVDDHFNKLASRLPRTQTRRCPSCGAIVRMPCRLCQTRELLAGGRIPPPKPVVETPIGLDLRPEHQQRYAQVRRWRREALRLGVTTKPHYDTP